MVYFFTFSGATVGPAITEQLPISSIVCFSFNDDVHLFFASH